MSQQATFLDDENQFISINEAAESINVSSGHFYKSP